MARAHRAVAVVLALVALLTGCSGDGEPSANRTTTTTAPSGSGAPVADHVGPFPVLAGSTTADGELAPGLPIATGATLLGPAFSDGDGFEALLVVTGDPVEVYNQYVDAAASLGMQAGGGGGCLPGFGSLACLRRLVDPSDGEALSIVVERRPVEGGFVSHAALRYEPPGSVDPEDAGVIGSSPPTSAVPAVELPAEVGSVSSRWSRLLSPDGPDIDLVDGTRLAGPPGPCPCGNRGWSAVLRLDGDADAEQALRGYARQLGVDDPEIERQGDGVLVADLGLVPGGITQLRTETDDRGTWLLVAVSFG